MEFAYIPSPSTGVIHLGPIPLRGYAFCIIIGVFVAVWYGNKRWVARGGTSGTVADVAVWAVPFGLVGGRLYHVITDYQLYFSDGEDWIDAFKIWEGGLGIWGAIAVGALGAWLGCRRPGAPLPQWARIASGAGALVFAAWAAAKFADVSVPSWTVWIGLAGLAVTAAAGIWACARRRPGIPLPAWADALAPGIALAQAVGRWGNWFNQELYGKETDLPWALEISAGDGREAGLYHPTFLYESLWCVGVALLVIWADRRFKLGHGRAFALYVAAYCVGRGWIEYMRVDEAHHVLGLRLNVWTSFVVFALAVVYMLLSAMLRPGREEIVEPKEGGAQAPGDADSVESGSVESGSAGKTSLVKGESGADENANDNESESESAGKS